MKSYLKFLSRNALYTVIEAAGLIVSIAFVILIGNYVWQQYSVAYENPIGDRVYGIGNGSSMLLSMWDKEEVESKIPEVETACRIGSSMNQRVTAGDLTLSRYGMEVDPSFFEIFPNYRLLEGDLAEFVLPDRCLLSQSLAAELFDGEAVGRQMTVVIGRRETAYTVCGVYADLGATLLQEADFLLYAGNHAAVPESMRFRVTGTHLTLMKVREGTDREELARKVETICRANYSETLAKEFPIHTLPEIYFEGGVYFFRCGNPTLLRMLTVVVLLLLVSAIFNYINLNLALSGRRAKEMATRRLLGSSRGAVFGRFIAESIGFISLCFGLALLLAYALVPTMDALLFGVSNNSGNPDAYIALQMQHTAGIYAAYLLVIVLLGLLSGIAPAVLAARFQPIDIVRGTFRRRTKMLFSKIFIVFQNTISVALIALALVMEVQMHHMAGRPLHARSEGIYLLDFWTNTPDELEQFRNSLRQLPDVGRVGYTDNYPGSIRTGLYFKESDAEIYMPIIVCDETAFDLMELELLEQRGSPKINSLWMSRSLANELAVADSLESYYVSRFANKRHPVEHFGGIYADVPRWKASESELSGLSSVLVLHPDAAAASGRILVVEVTGNYEAAAEAIRAAFDRWAMERYGMSVGRDINDYVANLQYQMLTPERTATRLVELFMVLAVVISLLGLLAMSTYYAGENTKSIAIRKVFGSNVGRELWRTVRDYMLLVAVAVAAGIPLAVWLAGRYLERFAYRVEHYGWVFAAAAVISVAIAFGSVLGQTLHAARTNPASELKKE